MAEEQYFHDLVTRYKNNSKKFWETIKTIVNRYQKRTSQTKFKVDANQSTNDINVIANRFNGFFINVGPTLLKLVPNVKNESISCMADRLDEYFFLDPVSDQR